MTTLAQQPAFNQFLGAVDAAFRARLDPPALLDRVEDGARRLVSRDDWLPRRPPGRIPSTIGNTCSIAIRANATRW